MLELRSLDKEFHGLKAIDNVSFRVEPGSITSLIGPNGAGKTTLINMVTGVFAPTRGEIFLDGHPVTGLRSNRIAALGARRTFQTVRLFNGLTVMENLLVGRLHRLGVASPLSLLLPMRLGDAPGRTRAHVVLESLGLTHLAQELATDLPYGTQRRVEIARALMGEPRFLLLDEPAAGMNESETAQLVDDVRRIRNSGITILLVEHDMSMVMSVSDRIVVLNFGRKIAEGPPADIQRNPEVIASYLGEQG